MPWVDEEMCVECGLCVDDCPVGAIEMQDSAAVIDNDECIRCGQCHSICPQEAVRHDGDRIPEEVKKNMEWVGRLLEHEYYTTAELKEKLIHRLNKHFDMAKTIAEQTLERIEELEV